MSIEASNIALINDNIEDIPHLIAMAKKTMKTININIAFAMILNIGAMTLAILGMLGPIEGALIHNIGSVIVVLHSLTLLNYNFQRKRKSANEKLGASKSLNKSIN